MTMKHVTLIIVAVGKQHVLNECVCILALGNCHAMCIFSVPHYIVICGLSGSITFFGINS